MNEPLAKGDAMALIRQIRAGGSVFVPSYAKKRMAEREMDAVDVDNILRGGWLTEEAEYENGHWRYRVRTNAMYVVVQFESETALTVITVWRKPS